MSEIDLIQAYFASINLSYVAGQWWIEISTALVVATYFAAKHIPRWLFAMVIALYFLSSFSAIWEVTVYSGMADQYFGRLADFRATKHIQQFVPIGGNSIGSINGSINYAVFILGTLSASAYAFVTWRRERSGK